MKYRNENDDDDCVSHPCWPLPALPRAFLASLNNAPMVMVVMMMAVMMMMVVMVMAMAMAMMMMMLMTMAMMMR